MRRARDARRAHRGRRLPTGGLLVLLGCGGAAVEVSEAAPPTRVVEPGLALPDTGGLAGLAEPALGGLSDLHTPERIAAERRLLSEWREVPSPRTAAELGALYTQAEECHRGAAWLVQALSTSPEDGEAWFWLGVNRFLLGEAAAADRMLDRARELGARSAALERFAGEVALELGEPEVARRAFERSLELDPTGWHARLNLALLAEDEGDLAEARASLEALVRLDPSHPTPHFRLARVLRALGDRPAAEAAERAHRRAAILEDLGLRGQEVSEPQAHLAVAWALSSEGRWEEALAEYEAAAEKTLSGPMAEKAREGVERCRRALATSGSDPDRPSEARRP